MAYAAEEWGEREVYVRPFPPGEGKWKISTAGGTQPRWRGDGKELFYAAADGKITAVAVKAGTSSFEPGVPAPLFESHITSGLVNAFPYDATTAGKRFPAVTTAAPIAGSFPPLTA